MHFSSVTLAATLLAAATAAPAEVELVERAAAPCSAKFTGFDNQYCNAKGSTPFYSKYLYEFDFSGDQFPGISCLRECSRSPECISYYVSDQGKCRVYPNSLQSSLTFNSSIPGYYSDYKCGYLTGNCGLLNGAFEAFPQTNGFVHPWGADGSSGDGSTVTLRNAQTDTSFSDSPNGGNFVDMTIVGSSGVAGLATFSRIPAGKKFRATYQYNFRGVSASSGSVPTSYTLEFRYCGQKIKTLTLATTKDLNVWKTASFQFIAPSCSANTQEFQWLASPKNGPANPNGYTAHIGVDAFTLKLLKR